MAAPSERLTYDEAHFGLPLEALRTRERAAAFAPEYVALFDTLSREQQLRGVAFLRGVHLGAAEACAHAKGYYASHAGISAAQLLEDLETDLAERAARVLVARFAEGDM